MLKSKFWLPILGAMLLIVACPDGAPAPSDGDVSVYGTWLFAEGENAFNGVTVKEVITTKIEPGKVSHTAVCSVQALGVSKSVTVSVPAEITENQIITKEERTATEPLTIKGEDFKCNVGVFKNTVNYRFDGKALVFTDPNTAEEES